MAFLPPLKPVRRLRWLREQFYRGPADLGLTIPTRKGYQSPTLTAAYWILALVVRHFTFGGRVMFLMACLILPISMISLQAPVFLLPFSILAFFVVNFLLGFVLRPRVDCRRRVPQRVTVGEPARAVYELRNRARSRAYDLRVDMLPWPHDLRWLPGPLYVDRLDPEETCVAETQFVAGRRGVYRLPAVRTASAFPFHLWCWGRTGDEGPETLLVHPRFAPLRRLRLPAGDPRQDGRVGWGAPVPGAGLDFLGCREFRNGDATRHLHWHSWARTGYPVVKEFQDTFQFQALLLLDTFRPHLLPRFRRRQRREDPLLEAGVTLAAAVVDALGRERAAVQFVCGGGDGAQAMPVTGANLLHVFDRLAGVEPEPTDAMPDLFTRFRGLSLKGIGVWILLLSWDAVRRELAEWLWQEGVNVRILLIEAPGAPRPAVDVPATVVRLQAGDIAAGRCHEV